MGQVIGHHWPGNAALNHVENAIDNGPNRLLALGLPDFGGQQKLDSLPQHRLPGGIRSDRSDRSSG